MLPYWRFFIGPTVALWLVAGVGAVFANGAAVRSATRVFSGSTATVGPVGGYTALELQSLRRALGAESDSGAVGTGYISAQTLRSILNLETRWQTASDLQVEADDLEAVCEPGKPRDAAAAKVHRAIQHLMARWGARRFATGNPDTAPDDLAQSAFAKVLAKCADMMAAANKIGYFVTVVQNQFRDSLGRGKYRTDRQDEYTRDTVGPDPMGGSLGLLAEIEARDTVTSIFKELTPWQCKLLWLSHGEGWTDKEIAKLRGCRSDTVKAARRAAEEAFARHGMARSMSEGTK